jgi:outer membrane protein OmpA-like peptidoglycan-associated protein
MKAALGVLAVLGSAACSSAPAHYDYKVPATRPIAASNGPAAPLATLSASPALRLPRLPPLPLGLVAVPAPSPCLLAAQVPDRTLGFRFNSADISASGRSTLKSFVAVVVKHNRELTLRRVHAEGYTSTDSPGARAYDKRLSDQRAAAVAAILRTVLPRVAVSEHGSGESDPLYPNDTAAHRAANRRTVVTFTFSGCHS